MLNHFDSFCMRHFQFHQLAEHVQKETLQSQNVTDASHGIRLKVLQRTRVKPSG